MDTPDRQLRAFVCIARLGSLSKAAEVLDQTQSSLSKQLASLEATIGQPLFIRTGRGVETTELGKQLYESTRRAYQEIDQVFESLCGQHATHGTVRLATVHTLSYYFIADVVASFVSTRPNVNLSLMGRSSPEVVSLVENGRADMGFVYDSAVDSGALTSSLLFDDEMALMVPRDCDLEGPQDLSALPMNFIGFPPEYALRRMLHSAGLQPKITAVAETVDSMMRLASSGIGACVLPWRIPEKMLNEYGLRRLPIAEPAMRRRVVLITRAGRVSSPLCDALVQCAMQIASRLREQRLE